MKGLRLALWAASYLARFLIAQCGANNLSHQLALWVSSLDKHGDVDGVDDVGGPHPLNSVCVVCVVCVMCVVCGVWCVCVCGGWVCGGVCGEGGEGVLSRDDAGEGEVNVEIVSSR